MLSRFTMCMYGHRPSYAGPLPQGIRQDTRHRTRHVLRPTQEIVEAYLADPADATWRAFRKAYLALLERRFREDRTPFDELADLAARSDVFLGCNCPTQKNPIPGRCHTYPALEFMKKKYPGIDVVIPSTISTISKE